MRKPRELPISAITPKAMYLRRVSFFRRCRWPAAWSPRPDTLTSRRAVTTYNNFYEFGSDKNDPATHGRRFKPRP